MSSDIQRYCKLLSHMNTSVFYYKSQSLDFSVHCFFFVVAILQSVMKREKKNSLILCMSEQWHFRGQLKVCTTTCDEWGMIVAGRLAYVNHIPAAHAFTTMSTVPVFFTGGVGGGGGGGQMSIRHTHVETGIYYQKNL